MVRTRWVVYEQFCDDSHRVNGIFGVFHSWDKANKICKKLQKMQPENWYGIRELRNNAGLK